MFQSVGVNGISWSRLLLLTEEFSHNDGGRLGLDSSFGFPLASNHLRFTASHLTEMKVEALIVSCKHSPTRKCTQATLSCIP